MSALITFNSATAGFNIKRDSLRIQIQQERGQNRSGSGKIETINQYGIMQWDFKALMTEAQYRRMIGFYSWGRQGKTFSISLKSSLAISTSLSGAATAGIVPLAGSSQFSTGDICLIRSATDDEFEVVQITSITTGVSASLASTLVFDYSSGAAFRHFHYMPSAILINTNFNPMEMDGSEHYSFDFQVVEAL